MESPAFVIAAVLGVGFACQWLAWRMRLPAILFLLLSGITLGPITGLLNPDVLLGDLLFPVVSLAVAVILFEGSLTLRIEQTRGIQRVIGNLVTIGFGVTWVGLTLAGHFIAGLDWSLAFLYGALVSVTGPTVIAPMIRSVKPTRRLANILRWEGILIDPIGALAAVLVFNAIVAGQYENPLVHFFFLLGAGLVAGLVGGLVLGFLLRRHLIPEYLQNLASLSFVLLVFTGSNLLAHESGLLAVTLMGVYLANQKDLHVEDILDFKEHLTILLLSFVFIILGARIQLDLLLDNLLVCVALLVLAKGLIRPLSILASSWRTSLNFREGLFLSWIAPRGIIAAAVAALFSLKLEGTETAGAELLAPLAFAMIIGTVIVESATAGLVARLLGQSAAEEEGVLIVGCNKVSMAVAHGLHHLGINILIADSDFEALKPARMAGFATYCGSVLSDRADTHLDLTGVTKVFAMTKNNELNTLVLSRYRPDVEPPNAYRLLPVKTEQEKRQEKALSPGLRFPILFSDQTSWAQMATLLSQGFGPKKTLLSDTFTLDDYVQRNPKAQLLFGLDDHGEFTVRSSDDWVPKAGWSIIALVPEQDLPLAQDAEDPSPGSA